MQVTIKVYHSREFRRQVLVETGVNAPEFRTLTVDARDLRPDLRKRYLEYNAGEESVEFKLENRFDCDPWTFDGPIDDANALLDLHDAAMDEEAKARDAAIKARDDAQKERDRADEEAREAKAKRQAAGLASLRSWALDNGSELLRERIKGGFEFAPLAGKEYARSILSRLTIPTEEVPDSFNDQFTSIKRSDRTTPDLQEMRNLRAVLDSIERENLAGVASALLVWITYHDADNEIDDVKRAEIEIEVIDPTGNDHQFYFLAS